MQFCGCAGAAEAVCSSAVIQQVKATFGSPLRIVESSDRFPAILIQSRRPITVEDSHERLPLAFGRRQRILVFDGRIDNRDQLRDRLEIPLLEASFTDGALVAAAFEQWGDDAPAQLIGDFALAVWEPDARRLLLAADPVGGRTVFYHASSAGMTFGTHPMAVRAFPGVPRGADRESLVRFLQLRMPEEERSYFDGIRRLPLGGRLIWSDGRSRVDRCRTIQWDRRISFRRADDYVEAAREILDNAVRVRLRARGVVASQLSGGLDSGGVTATAARRLAPATLHTVTIVPDPAAPVATTERFSNEWPHAEAVSRMYPNIRSHRVFGSERPDRTLAAGDFMAAVGQPLARPTHLPWFLSPQSTLKAIGADVLLVGIAGNSTLSWHGPHVVGDCWRNGAWPRAAELVARRARRDGVHRGWRFLKTALLSQLLPAGVVERVGPGRHPTMTPALAPHVKSPAGTVLDDFRPPRGPERDRALRRYIMEYYLVGQVLHSSLRSLDGVEWRDPYADINMIEFCFSIPPEQFLADGQSRSLARRVLADRLPHAVVTEQRRGRQSPEWFSRMTARRSGILADIDRLSRSEMVTSLVDVRRLKDIATNWPPDTAAAERRMVDLRHVLSLGIAAGQFILWTEGEWS